MPNGAKRKNPAWRSSRLGEDARRVEARHAEPVDGAVRRDERARVAVGEERVVGDRRERRGRRGALRRVGSGSGVGAIGTESPRRSWRRQRHGGPLPQGPRRRRPLSSPRDALQTPHQDPRDHRPGVGLRGDAPGDDPRRHGRRAPQPLPRDGGGGARRSIAASAPSPPSMAVPVGTLVDLPGPKLRAASFPPRGRRAARRPPPAPGTRARALHRRGGRGRLRRPPRRHRARRPHQLRRRRDRRGGGRRGRRRAGGRGQPRRPAHRPARRAHPVGAPDGEHADAGGPADPRRVRRGGRRHGRHLVRALGPRRPAARHRGGPARALSWWPRSRPRARSTTSPASSTPPARS